MELARFRVREDRYLTYVCKHCEEETAEAVVVPTPMEPAVIPGSFASPSAIAHLAVQKYVMHSPLYCLEQEFDRQGLKLSRQTMSNWLLKATEDWLQPIYDVLHQQLCKRAWASSAVLASSCACIASYSAREIVIISRLLVSFISVHFEIILYHKTRKIYKIQRESSGIFQPMDRPVRLWLFHIQALHEPAVLLRGQHPGFHFTAWPLETAGFQALVQQQESIPFPVQRFDSVPAPATEQKQRIGERIQLKLLLTMPAKPSMLRLRSV